MTRQLIERYIWIVDTIQRHQRLTREKLSELWLRSPMADNGPLTRRTFYNYRNGIEQGLGIVIELDRATNEYYIDERHSEAYAVTNMMLENSAIGNTLATARDIADKILLEPVPTARGAFDSVVESLRGRRRLRIDYHPYTRTRPHEGIILEPYLLKLVKKRWYMLGMNVQEHRLKTYALDRIIKCRVLDEGYEVPEDFDSADYFKHAFGIVVENTPVHDIVLQVTPHQAKYFRALPLHPSQQEELTDSYSLFRYRMRVTDDLVTELLSYGSRVTVLEPPTLRTRMRLELVQSLAQYQDEVEDWEIKKLRN